jgi:quinol-cytochrome oxidoreductase complex cytochrome b subunit
VTPEGIKPEWYFLPTYQFLKYLPKFLGLALRRAAHLLLLLWPFWTARARGGLRAQARRELSLAALLLTLLLGLVGWLSERADDLQRVRFDMYNVPEVIIEGAEHQHGKPLSPARRITGCATPEGRCAS